MITSGQFKFTDQGLSVQDRFEWIKSLRYETFKPEVNNEKVFEVDLNTRTIVVPKNQSELGVQDDMSAEVFWFAVPRYFEGHDLAENNKKWLVHVYTANKDPEAREILLPIKYRETQKADENNRLSNIDFNATVSTANGTKRESTPGILLGWPITYDITKYPGNVSFALRCYEIGTEGAGKDQIVFSLGTKPATGKITQSYSFNTGLIPDESESVFPTKSIVMDMLDQLMQVFGDEGFAQINYSDVGPNGRPTVGGVELAPHTQIKLPSINNTPIVNSEDNFQLATSAELNEAKNTLNAQATSITNLNSKIDNVQKEASSNLATEIKKVNDSISLNTNSISNLNNEMGTTQSRVGDAERKIAVAEGDILDLKTALGTEGGNGTSLTERVAANEEDIAEIQEMIGGGEGSEDSLVDRIESLENILGGGEGVEVPEGSLPAQVAANAAAITAIKDGAELDSFADVEAALEEVGVKPEDRQAIIDEAVSKAVENEGVAGAISAIAAILEGSSEGLNTFAEVELALQNAGVSQETVDEIVAQAKSDILNGEKITALETNINTSMEDISELETSFGKLETTVKNLTGDNEELRLAHVAEGSILYLYHTTTDENGNVNEELNTDPDSGNVIAQTVVVGGGGGGSAASYNLVLNILDKNSSFSILKGKSASINYDAVLTQIDDENKTPLKENITLYVYVDDVLRSTTVQPAGPGSIDVTPYLSTGTSTIKVTAAYTEVITNDAGETANIVIRNTKRWYISVIDMYVKSSFDDNTEVFKSAISYGYTPMGNLEKTVYFILDGEEMEKVTTSLSNKAMSVTIPMQSHGAHSFEVYCTGVVEGETIESEHLYYDIMFEEEGNSTPIIRMVPRVWEAQQYTTIPIDFSVYDEANENPTVSLLENGEVKSTMTVDRTEQVWNYRAATSGTKTLCIECGEGRSREISLDISEFPYEINPVSNGLELDFNPVGRTNSDSDYNVFHNDATDAEGNEIPVSWKLSDNFDWVNGGWKTDANGDSYFCVKAGTSVDINYLLFNDNNTVAKTNTAGDGSIIYSKGNGKEFKIVFKTTNTAQSQGTWLSCAAPAANNTPVGLQMDIHNGYVHSSVESLTIPYSEDDIIEFDMNIIPTSFANNEIDYTIADVPMVITYEDGTPVQPQIITSAATSFKQSSAVPITIGCPYCDVNIYRIKAYNRYLSDEEILNNFIADARSAEEMVDRYLRNQIYDENTGELTPESVANACPDLRVLKLEVPRFTNDKKDKVDIISAQMIYKNGTRPEDNWTAVGGQHNGQGTSSNKYGYAARNIDVNLKKAKIVLSDGTEVSKLALNEDSVPTNYFNLKVNVASSENANNALLQRRFNRYLPYDSVAQQKDPRVKNSMEFVNCVLFIKEANTDLSTHEEFSDTEWHFYAIGNIGDSKKTDSSRLNDKKDTNEFVVEIVDWNRDLSTFPKDTMMDASKYVKEKKVETDPTEYIFLKDSNLGADGILFEKIDGEYVHSLDETINMEKTYYVDILENDDYGGDFTYEWRYITEYETDPEKIEEGESIEENEAKNAAVQAAAKTAWNDFYRFITQDIDENDEAAVAAWKKGFEDRMILDAALYYYLFTLRYTMVDNRAKNSFWHYAKCADGKYRFDFWDYDNDTALGIDNAGKLEMSYGVEDQDTDEMGAYLFRGADSTFFTRLVKFYTPELEAMFKTLESNDNTVFSSTSLINEFDAWQSQFPEELWRLNYVRLYKRTYVCGSGADWDNALPQLNAEGKPAPEKQFLSEMMNGKKKYQRRQFERNQDIYMSSKFFGSLNRGDVFNLRGQGKVSGLTVEPDYTISITPYSNMYINLENATDSRYYHNRCYAGQTYIIPYPTEVMDFIYAYGASQIQSLGDLSKMYLQTATLGSGSRLKEIILGNETEGYSNKAFTTLQLSSSNKLLETLNIRNLSELKGSLPVSNIPSLKRVYAQGTGITSVQFANNGLIEEAYLPATVNDLQLNNLSYLTNLNIESYDALSTLLINNCSGVDELAIVEAAENLRGVRLTNIDWQLDNSLLLLRLLECGDYADQEKQSILTGRVEVGTIRQSEIEAFRAAWPNLELVYDENNVIPQHYVNFYREHGDETPIYSILKDEMYTLTSEDDPSQMLIEQGLLVKEMTPQYTYLFNSWTPDLEGVQVTQNLDFYGTFTPIIRQYTVKWYDDDNERTLLEEVKTNYGTSVKYTKARPVKNTAAVDNKYHLFTGWDVSTGYITGDTKVHPVWETSTANININTASEDLSAIQLYALSKQTLNNGLAKFIADGAPIKLQTGYMPDYDGITLIESPVHFDGTSANVIKTDYKLFDEDKSFVLAIDFTTKHSSTAKDNTLMSCGGAGNIDRGIRLYAPYAASGAYAAASVQWNVDKSVDVSTQVATPTRSYRDICVIRHKAGDPNLYVYTNNRFSMEAVKETVLTGAATSAIEHTLCFGAQSNATGALSNYGTGSINYAKLWFDDLGAEECKKICSWTKDELTFRRCGTEAYYIPDSENTAGMSFVADQLLEEPIVFDGKKNEYKGGWDISDLRAWLKAKMFAGVSLEWQQLIQPVAVKSLFGSKNATNHSDGTTVSTVDEFYIPAYAEIYSDAALDSVYNKELSSAILYSPLDGADERKLTYPDGRPGFWWTRTPNKTAANKQIVVDKNGEVGRSTFFETQEDGSQLFYNYLKEEAHGVLLAFSIGEVK